MEPFDQTRRCTGGGKTSSLAAQAGVSGKQTCRSFQEGPAADQMSLGGICILVRGIIHRLTSCVLMCAQSDILALSTFRLLRKGGFWRTTSHASDRAAIAINVIISNDRLESPRGIPGSHQESGRSIRNPNRWAAGRPFRSSRLAPGRCSYSRCIGREVQTRSIG